MSGSADYDYEVVKVHSIMESGLLRHFCFKPQQTIYGMLGSIKEN